MILVTGASGFLGSHVVAYLQACNFDVMPVYFSPNVIIKKNYWSADLSRPDHVAILAQQEKTPTVIMHLAGHIEIALQPHHENPMLSPVPGKENISLLYSANVQATANLIDYALRKNIRKFIFASSQSVYGMPAEKLLQENTLCKPLEYYAATKLACEQMLEVAALQAIDITVLRFPGLYGECRFSGLVHNLCISALQKNEITITASYPLPLDVIHIEDVVLAIYKTLAVSHTGFLRLNIATGEPCSFDILASRISRLVKGCRVTYSSIQQPIVCMDPTKAHELLGWVAVSPDHRLQNMLERLQYAQKNIPDRPKSWLQAS